MSILLAPAILHAASPSFADFDRRAKAGERLNVVFFGASLTWGANATDPNLTSYRGAIARKFEAAYPQAHFHFWDAAIGGTGSQLGVFRFDRDVLSHQPDLVFLDFSANDDIYSDNIETLASYESLVRRIILDARAPVVQVIFPFKWNVAKADLERMKRRDAHLAISRAYNTAVGDAIALAIERVKSGASTIDALWPYDGVHPGDAGYALFADAAWQGFEDGVKHRVVCAAPEKMLNAETYLRHARVRISTLGELPAGWRRGAPNLTSAYFDMLMSRWLDDEVIASNRKPITNADGKKQLAPQEVARLKVKFRGAMVLLFGEGTPKSCKYRAYIDGKLVEHTPGGAKEPLKEFDSANVAGRANGNTHHWQVIAENLDAGADHTIEIEPVFAQDKEQELRIESVCVAGGDAKVFPIQTE
jgi:lysophospholipase L1-like esterase